MNKYLIIIIVILSFISIFLYRSNERNKQLYSIAENNFKAANNDKLEYQLTVDQLKYNNDSVIQKLDSVRKELKIKDSKLNSIHYIYNTIEKIDTIITKDTIFRDSNFKLDTTLNNKQYTLKLYLAYPDTIAVHPKFDNELYAIFEYKKETIKPPKKFFIARWFQKKHTVVQVTVKNSNEYVNTKETRFINIIK